MRCARPAHRRVYGSTTADSDPSSTPSARVVVRNDAAHSPWSPMTWSRQMKTAMVAPARMVMTAMRNLA